MWLDQAHRLTFSWVSSLQVSSPPVWRSLAVVFDCLWCFKASPCMAWNTRRELLFKIVLSGWRDGCLFCEMPELLLALLSPFLLSDCSACTQPWCWVHKCPTHSAVGSSLWWQAASPGLQTIPNSPHFTKCMRAKREVWLFFASGSWSSLSIALGWLWVGPWWNQPPGRFQPSGWSSLSEDLEGEQSPCEGWLLHFQMSCLLRQPSPKSRNHQAKQTQLGKTNLAPKAGTGSPSSPGKGNHCCRCLLKLRAGGFGLLFSFLAFGVLCCNLYLNIEDRKNVCFVCLFGVFFLCLWLLKEWRVYCVWNAGRV